MKILLKVAVLAADFFIGICCYGLYNNLTDNTYSDGIVDGAIYGYDIGYKDGIIDGIVDGIVDDDHNLLIYDTDDGMENI